jgi:broad specificity phosphatase PhoE
MILHITRHGQVLPAAPGQVENVDYPRGDRPLSALGREQARLLGERLRELGFEGRIYASPYRRTVETAQVIADVVNTEVIPSAPFREVVVTAEQIVNFRGATGVELEAEFPRVRSDAGFPYPWWTQEAETSDDVEARVAPLVDELARGSRDALLVGHGASVGGATRHVLRHCAPDRLSERRDGWNCILTSFRMSPVFEILHLADTAHLPPGAVTANALTKAEALELREKGER